MPSAGFELKTQSYWAASLSIRPLSHIQRNCLEVDYYLAVPDLRASRSKAEEEDEEKEGKE